MFNINHIHVYNNIYVCVYIEPREHHPLPINGLCFFIPIFSALKNKNKI